MIGDHHGALTLGAIARHGLSGVRTHQDRLLGERALQANAERLGLGGFAKHELTPELVAGARVVLLQLPRSLDALDEIAGLIAEHADPDVLVVAGGRVKHMTTAMNDVLGRHFADVQAHLARQKSRVLVASRPRPKAERPASAGPSARSTRTSASRCARTAARSPGRGSTSARARCCSTSTRCRRTSRRPSTSAAARGCWPSCWHGRTTG